MHTSPELTAGLNARPLRSTSRRLAAGIAVLTLGWPVLAAADCVDTRKPTAGEMEFHSRAIATLVAALQTPRVRVSIISAERKIRSDWQTTGVRTTVASATEWGVI